MKRLVGDLCDIISDMDHMLDKISMSYSVVESVQAMAKAVTRIHDWKADLINIAARENTSTPSQVYESEEEVNDGR